MMPLVAGSLLFVLFHDALVDVGALLVNGGKHATRIALEHILAFGIADFLDYFACDERHVNVRFGFHFSSQHYLTGSNQSFASYFRTGGRRPTVCQAQRPIFDRPLCRGVLQTPIRM